MLRSSSIAVNLVGTLEFRGLKLKKTGIFK